MLKLTPSCKKFMKKIPLAVLFNAEEKKEKKYINCHN